MSLQTLLSNYIEQNPAVLLPLFKGLLPKIGPQVVEIIKSDPDLIKHVQPFAVGQVTQTPLFKSFDAALTDESRLFVQQNLATCKSFIDSDAGKMVVALWVEEWRRWAEASTKSLTAGS